VATYTYSATRGSDLDRARELLGGTSVAEATADEPGEALRSDEDIQAILGREGFARGVAWLAAALYALFAQQPVRITASGKTIDYGDRLKAWDKLAAPLREALALAGEIPPPVPVRTARIGQITAGDDAARRLR
jgi:hypothetical protein